MARTKATARASTGGVPAPVQRTDSESMEEELTPEEIEKKKAELEEFKKQPMKVEVKHLEKRFNQKGHQYIVEQKEVEVIEQFQWYDKFVLCVTHVFDHSNKYVQQRVLSINSSFLKKLLKDMIGSYPGISFYTETVSLTLPCKCLFHYLDQLKEHTKQLPIDSEDFAHLGLLVDFIETEFADTITESKNLKAQGMMSHEHLWTLYPPETIFFSTILGQPRIFKQQSYSYQYTQMGAFFCLNGEFYDYDGSQFGTRSTQIKIPEYVGAEPIHELNAFPFIYHPEKDDVEKALLARGRRFEELAGQHLKEYKGIALCREGCRASRLNIDGRVMIDCATVHRLEPDLAFTVTEIQDSKEVKKAKRMRMLREAENEQMDFGEHEQVQCLDKLDDLQCMSTNSMVRGFSFTEKQFLEFFVNDLKEVDWNDACFDKLVLPAEQKDTVQALVSTHSQESSDFDDIVRNKGRGLILVLHGPPGVGKTLTAECVAEYTHRPLYMVSSGDLGMSSGVLDSRLSRILDMAGTWKAVLLIDEADVFLEARSAGDLERNGMVSIFLRVLEYYAGILFLTTNRVRTFDDAFKSRIHVPLKYEPLPHASRLLIWRNFLEKMDRSTLAQVDEAGFDRLAASDLNGRQIKNVIRTAKSLAAHKKVPLGTEQLEQVMRIQMQFERDLVGRDE